MGDVLSLDVFDGAVIAVEEANNNNNKELEKEKEKGERKGERRKEEKKKLPVTCFFVMKEIMSEVLLNLDNLVLVKLK